MEEQIFKDLHGLELIETLDSNADTVEERTYFEKLTHEELTELRSEFSDISIDIARVEDKKADAMQKFKIELKPLKSVALKLLTEIKTGHFEKEGRLYKIVDRDSGYTGFYTEEGKLIEQRPSTPGERNQFTIQGNRKLDKIINE